MSSAIPAGFITLFSATVDFGLDSKIRYRGCGFQMEEPIVMCFQMTVHYVYKWYIAS